MKRATAFLLAILMIMTACAAMAEHLSIAGAEVNLETLEKYPSFEMDEESGAWRVRSLRADSQEDWMSRKVSALSSRGVMNLYLEMSGNVHTGVVTPELVILYAGSKALNAQAVSIAADGVRYDLAAVCNETQIGRSKGEEIRAALDEAGIAMLEKIAEAGACSVCLHGEEQRYETELLLQEEYESEKAQLESESLLTLDVLNLIDLQNYDLWDLTAAAWQGKTGMEIQLEEITLGTDVKDPSVDEVFGLVERNTENTKILQEMLGEAGFLSGKANTTYSERVRQAVRNAQQYYGMIVTGTADRALCQRLEGIADMDGAAQEVRTAEAVMEESIQAQAGVLYELAETADIRLSRCWFAPYLSAVCDTGVFSQQAVLNTDNTLMIFDGSLQNLGVESMIFYSDVEAKLTYEGKYGYECTVVCLRDGGEGFDSVLLPLAESRLIIYAEIPGALSQAEGSWQLDVQLGGKTLSYQVQ